MEAIPSSSRPRLGAAVAGLSTDWVDFELGEDVRDTNRLQQDAEWANAVADGRAHVSHREMAMLHAPQVCMAIADYRLVEEMVDALRGRTSIISRLTPDLLTFIVEYAMPGQGHLVTACIERRKVVPLLSSTRGDRTIAINEEFPFRICVRKRPMLPFESEYGAYNVCDTDNSNVVTLHEGRLARNGRWLTMTHHQFAVDRVYDEYVSNDGVCRDAVEPLLSWALHGKSSTLLCFGQTGTGKTYTLYGALDYISRRLVGHSVRITFYEVHGKKCYDLLQDRKVVHLRADANDEMHIRGAKVEEIAALESPAQLMAVLYDALQLRSTEVTERNPISSRSHAVCSIEVLTGIAAASIDAAPKRQSLGQYLKGKQNTTGAEKRNHNYQKSSNTTGKSKYVFGRISLVDLAGSERNYETMKMTAAQHKESADINFALYALKNCFRAFHSQLDIDAMSEEFPAFNESGKLQMKRDAFGGIAKAAAPTAADIATRVERVKAPVRQAMESNGDRCGDGNESPTSVSSPADTNRQVVPVTRIPFRSHLLTRVLKACFTSGKNHRTTIIATVSPTPTDLQHSINTVAHVVLMCPELYALSHRVAYEVPLTMYGAAHLGNIPVHEWSNQQVLTWLSKAERGRFAHVVLPPGIDGSRLVQLSANNLSELFMQQLNTARNEKEGQAWVESAVGEEASRRVRNIGKALWSALRREMQSILARTIAANSNSISTI